MDNVGIQSTTAPQDVGHSSVTQDGAAVLQVIVNTAPVSVGQIQSALGWCSWERVAAAVSGVTLAGLAALARQEDGRYRYVLTAAGEIALLGADLPVNEPGPERPKRFRPVRPRVSPFDAWWLR